MKRMPPKAASILIRLVCDAYQKLNVLVVLGDTLDISWVFPGGEADSIQGATAQDHACGRRKRLFVNVMMETHGK